MAFRELIERLALQPHPEGGWYRELYRSAERVQTARGDRAALTQIYYLLEPGQFSRWHVIDSEEVWHFYAGAGLELYCYDPVSEKLQCHILGSPLEGNDSVAVIPPGCWQAARPLNGFALVGCSVAPGFEFSEFRFVSGMPGHEGHMARELAGHTALL